MSDFSEEEEQKILEIVHKVTKEQMLEYLQDLAEREKKLYIDHFKDDEDLKEITIWRIAILSAAADMFSS